MGRRGSEKKQGHSLSEAHGSVAVPYQRHLIRRILAVAGPAYLVSVGYMDPGNWATDLAAGAQFNYALIWVLLMSNLMAVLLQSLAARLGVVRGLDLAQACRAEYPSGVNFSLYILCEIAITATDLAEVIGSAIALQLLFGLPLIWGVVITAADTFALLFLSQFGIRKMEALIIGLITIIGGSFLIEIILARPDWGGVLSGFTPTLPNYPALFVAIGILGATVMPHNLYLHSSLVQTRKIGPTLKQKWDSIRLNTIDSAVALNMAFFVNAAILIMAAAVFYRTGHFKVAEIQDAYRLLEPILGAAVAPVAFAVALLASGQSSTITGTLAGQVVMEGFLNIRIQPWVRRLITRILAIVPSVLTILYFGERGTGTLLILSQVVLSLQLPFAIIPLIHFVSDRHTMGPFSVRLWIRILAWTTALVVVALNAELVWETLKGWILGAGHHAFWIELFVLPLVGLLALLLAYITFKPWIAKILPARRTEAEPGVHAPADSLEELLKSYPEGRRYSRVAVALDFSGRDRRVLAETLRFLGDSRPDLALMHVTESAPARFLGKESGDIESQYDETRLKVYAEELRKLGFQVRTMLGSGKPVPELARMVESFGADLLVLGAHGHRFILDLFFGSTADALRHRVSASVLVVAKQSPRVPL
ncbi:MAG: Nramp family divalent metal transporter [Acidobacteriota bacterium]|jgi:manganese transport protein